MTTVVARRTAPGEYTRFFPVKLLVNDIEYQPQFFTVATDEELAAIGVYRVDVTPPEGQRWTNAFADDNGVPVAVFEARVTTSEQVDAERDRRIEGGFEFNGVMFQARVQDQKRIAGAGTLALGAMVAGVQPGNLRWHGGDEDFAWIAADNTTVPMDAQTVFLFGQAAANWESRHVFAARSLKDISPIPADYTDDEWWPA